MMLLWMVLAASSLLKIQTSGSRFPSADCHGEPENEAFSEFWLHSTAPTAVASNINAQCIAHTREYLTAYRSRSSWAVKMYESSGRIIEDLIYTESGNVHHQSGLFDECISIQPDGVPFQGKYCSIFFDLRTFDGLSPGSDTVKEPVEEEPLETVSYFQMASASFCIPSTCSAHDLRSAVAQRIGHRFDSRMNYSVVTISNEDYCFTREKIDSTRKLKGLSFIPIALFSLLALAVISATIYEAWRENYLDRPIQNQVESFPIRTFHCFSLIKNWRKLISTEDSKDSLPCLHGIRVLSIFWVVLLHVTEESFNRYTYNKLSTKENAFRWEAQIISNGTVAVDTFFLLGGLIVAYSQLGKLDRNKGHFDLKRFYLHRYFRLTPLYAAMLAFMATLFPLMGNGPDWNRAIKMSQIIQNNWWAYLLYINNFIPKVEKYVGNPLTVMSEAWYLACDMQMYWLSPLLIYPLWRWKKAGLVWVSTVFFLFVGAAAITFMTIDMSPTLMFSRPSEVQALENYCRYNYHQMYARIPPYLLGIILGWLLHETKNRKVQMNRYLAATGWAIATLVACSVMFGVIPFLDEVKVPTINPFFLVFYGSFHRSAWAAAVGWMIFACINGYGGFVNSLLSWKLFVPLARMCYAVYLIHFNFIKAYSSHMRKPLYFTEFYLYTIFPGIVAFNFLIGSVMSVFIEMPFLNLDTLLFPSNTDASKTKKIERKANDEELPMNQTPGKN